MTRWMMAVVLATVIAGPAMATPLPEEDLGEMAAGRQRLAAVTVPEVRAHFPELVAQVESSFDCWTLNPEATAPEGRFAECRGDFMTRMSRLEGLVTAAAPENLAASP